MTVDDIIDGIGRRPYIPELPAPAYQLRDNDIRIGLAVEDMKRHMTDEGWQLFAGLEAAGYDLAGRRLITKSARLPLDSVTLEGATNLTDVRTMLGLCNPGTVVLQDKREWHCRTPRDFRDREAEFTHVDALAGHPAFKLTVLKDAQHSPEYHRDSALEIGCHAWITYYHPRIVKHLAPYVRPAHCIRTYHSIDSGAVPKFSPRRLGCLLSGAVSGAYPLRARLAADYRTLPDTDYLGHPGYHNRGSQTPKFLETLSRYKVAICTASRFGYAVRKIMEATACGCRVITDLPADDVLPAIEGNLWRVRSDWSVAHIAGIVREALAEYDPEVQRCHADKAKAFYDYRVQGRILAESIDALRRTYGA